ncbi:MAG: hypothetical protein ACKVTZ_02620 [Bacteroidia bacterium]
MKYILLSFLFLIISPIFAQFDEKSSFPPPDSTPVVLDSNAKFVLPTVLEAEGEEEIPNIQNLQDLNDDDDFGVMMGERIPEDELIQNLEKPLNLHLYSPKIQEVVKVCEAEASKILGEYHTKIHLRLYRDRLETMEAMYKKIGDKFDDGYVGAMLYYTIVYQGHTLDVLTFCVQDGQIIENEWQRTANTLKAYRELLDGNLKVSPDEALKRVFGNRKPYDRNIHLRYEQRADLEIPKGSTYQRPEIWWYIWENACTVCQEGEVDANNTDNYLLEKVDRRKQRW